jgi:D-sedoheptulose 7-phosphate isomerase
MTTEKETLANTSKFNMDICPDMAISNKRMRQHSYKADIEAYDFVINKNLTEHKNVLDGVLEQNRIEIAYIARLLVEALSRDGCIFWAGNGGSASDCQHLAAELVGKYKKKRQALRSMALTTDTSILTCIANDFGYSDVFSRQLEALGRCGDVLIGVSTSGNSENICAAVYTARRLGMKTVLLLGKGGGRSRDLADLSLVINSNSTARVQECHITIGHILCDLIEQELGDA